MMMMIGDGAAMGYRGIIFDLDGTIYLSERLIPGARQTIEWLGSQGCGVVYVSNKPLYPRSAYAQKLCRLGIPTPDDRVINSTRALVYSIQRECADASLYVLGEQAMRDELVSEGLELTESVQDIDIVVASFDRTLDYRKLNIAHQALVKGAQFWATNGDATCPVEDGALPDAAGVIAYLEATTGRHVERILGKPSAEILKAALAVLGVERGECLMVGDRLTTDMVMGIQAGMDTALVLTGVTKREDLQGSGIHPTWVLDSVADIPSIVAGGSSDSRRIS